MTVGETPKIDIVREEGDGYEQRVARIIALARRILKKSPRFIVARLFHEVHVRIERYRAPARGRKLLAKDISSLLGHENIGRTWDALAGRAYVAAPLDCGKLEKLLPNERKRIIALAAKAVRHEVSLLGSGPVSLGDPIDWHLDYKTGIGWPPAYCASIEYNNLDQPSDVKFPWEMSRMQWMIPLAQAYLLTGDDRYAQKVRELLEHWIANNPYAGTIVWSCTMDVALRAITWTYFFHALNASPSWSDTGFRKLFLASLFSHGDFTARHLEKSDINGNHYTADAAGLVFLGLFFGDMPASKQWVERGWEILTSEILLQVYPDGVDFEASIPYHRPVQELFPLPAIYRQRLSLPVEDAYRERLLAMARFTAAYSRTNGSIPLWGDADDARTLPFKSYPINDHRYLVGIAGLALQDSELVRLSSGPRHEAAWLLGPDQAQQLPESPNYEVGSQAFNDGGFYIMRSKDSHIFFDCGPLGLAGRGGHGHNDLLSFSAVIEGVELVSDCGAYLYTADYRERNNFRSTAYHNTPIIDGQEINRFVRPDYLWFLENDAAFMVEDLDLGDSRDRVIASHTGYARLDDPVIVRRTIDFDHASSTLSVGDQFIASQDHLFEVPLHLAESVVAERETSSRLKLGAMGKIFSLDWESEGDWELVIGSGRISRSYGQAVKTTRLCWRRTGIAKPLKIILRPLK